MLNLIKMNLYKLSHQKAFYIVPVSMAIVCSLMVYLTWLAPRLVDQASQITTETGFHMGIVAGGAPGVEHPPITEDFNLCEFMDEVFGSGIMIILFSVGAAILANSERKHGFIKTVAGQVSPRGMLALAKLPGMLLESLLILVFAVLGCALSGRILFSGFVTGSLSALAGALAVQLLLALALCALVLTVCTLAGNAASGIITGIILSAGLTPMLYTLANKVLWNYFHVPQSFDLSRYSLSLQLISVTSVSGTKELAFGLIIGAAYLVACSVGAYVIIQKKDIV